MPYNQWSEFKIKMKENEEARLKIAEGVWRLGENITPDQLLNLFNEGLKTQYTSVHVAAENVRKNIEITMGKVSENPLNHISSAMQQKLVALGRNQLMPLLASFIREDSKKAQFLAQQHTDQAIYQFMTKNSQKIQQLFGAAGEALRTNAQI